MQEQTFINYSSNSPRKSGIYLVKLFGSSEIVPMRYNRDTDEWGDLQGIWGYEGDVEFYEDKQ